MTGKHFLDPLADAQTFAKRRFGAAPHGLLVDGQGRALPLRWSLKVFASTVSPSDNFCYASRKVTP